MSIIIRIKGGIGNQLFMYAAARRLAFKNNQDIHSLTASQVFGVPINKVSDDYRRKAKAINFGIIYGITQYGLAKQISVSHTEALDFINSYFKKFPQIKDYMNSTIKTCRKQGYVSNIFGRRIHLRGINDKNFSIRSFQERAAINAPIQGSAADIIRLAMIKIDKILEEKENYSIIRKIYAPIWIKGPIANFIDGKTIIVGDAAGQAKPTTAGGIFTSGMGGIYAGQAISKFLKTNNQSDLLEYQKKWNERFGGEFEKQIFARKILERIDNQTINKLFKSITPEIIKDISEKDDFDFHTSSIIKLLGMKGSIKTAQTLIGSEIKKLWR